MNSDMQIIRDFGEELKPPADQPPLPLRGRVLGGIVAPQRARPRARSWAVTAMLGGAVAASLVVMAAGQTIEAITRPRPPVATQTAQSGVAAPSTGRLLEIAANRVSGEPGRPVRGDQFIYTESVALLQDLKIEPRGVMVVWKLMVVRLWRSVDGTRDGVIQVRPAEAGDAVPWQSQTVSGCVRTDACRLNPVQVAELPTDADGMHQYLYRSEGDDFAVVGIDSHERALNRAGVVLQASRHAPAVQAAVFQAIGRINGVSVRAAVSDVAGRQGVAVAYAGDRTETELVFEPETYRYLGVNRSEQWLASPLGDHPNLWTGHQLAQREAVTSVAVVDEAGLEKP